MTKTIVFLDVDGVLNVVRRQLDTIEADSGWPRDTFRRQKVDGYTITYSRDLIDRLNALSAREDVEFRWLTTWLENAPTMLAPALGLRGHSWEVLGSVEVQRSAHGYRKFSDYSPPDRWWKLDAIRAATEALPEEEINIIWVDDDHVVYRNEVRPWFESLGEHVFTAIISPALDTGLSLAQVELMEDIAAGRPFAKAIKEE